MSRQFDVLPNPLRSGRAQRPYVVIVQHIFYNRLPSRVVVPLVVPQAILAEPRLNPALTVQGQLLHLSPTEIFTISINHLRPPVANLEADRDRIVAALDLVFTEI